MLGSLATKGEHLYLDRDHPDWRKALRILIEHMQRTRDEHDVFTGRRTPRATRKPVPSPSCSASFPPRFTTP